MADDVASISLQVKIDKLREELLKIPGISKQSAEGMLRAYSTEYKKLQKEAQQTADKMKKEAERARDAWKGAAERTASLMGGAFGDISDSLFDLGERFGQVTNNFSGWQRTAAMSAAGATAVGFALTFAAGAAIGAASATIQMAQASTEAASRLEKMGLLTDDQSQKANALRLQLAGLAVAQDQVSVSFAESTPLYGNVVSLVTGITVVVGHAIDAMGQIIPMAMRVTDAFSVAFAPPVGLAVQYIRDQLISYGVAAAETLGRVSQASQKTAQDLRRIADEQLVWAGAIRQTDDDARAMMAALGMIDEEPAKVHKVTQAVDELAKARKRAQDELRAQHFEALADDSQRVIMSTVAHQQALDAKLAAEVAFEQELLAVRVAGQEAYDAVTTQAQMARQEAVSQASQMALSANLQAVEQLSSAILQATGEQIAARKREHRATMAEYQSQKDVVAARLESGKITREQAEERLAQIEAEEALARQQNAETRKQQANAAKRAFAANKAARIAAVVSEAALALVALTTAFAYLGPGAVPAAAAITVPLAATQVGIIAAQKAPKFATGGMVGPDPVHRPIYATPREAVLTERGVDAAGGPDGVASLNRGGGMSSGGGVAAVHLDGALLGAATVQVMRSDPRVRRELARTRGLAVGQRARYAR